MPPANKENGDLITVTASIAMIVSVIHLVNNRVYIHVHAVLLLIILHMFVEIKALLGLCCNVNHIRR